MSRFVCIMSNLAVLLSLCASTARADAPGNIYVSALQKSGGTAFGACDSFARRYQTQRASASK